MPRKKKITLNPDMYIEIINPNFLFSLQRYFQSHGVIFIDLNTGQPIYGQANIDTLGMVTSLPDDAKTKSNDKPNGFLLVPMEPKKVSVDVEAILTVYQPPENNENLITIQVVNYADLEKWYLLAAEVGKNFVELDEFNNTVTDTTFRLVPLTAPDPDDRTNSAVNAMLGNIQKYRPGGGSLTAISDLEVDGQGDDFDENEDEV